MLTLARHGSINGTLEAGLQVRRQRAVGKWADVRSAARMLGDFTELQHKIRIRATGDASATTVVGSAHELEALPFWEQGDASMHTDDMVEKRAALSTHPLVLAELQQWWETAQRSMQMDGMVDTEVMPKAEYLRISMLLAKTMLEMFAEADLRTAVCRHSHTYTHHEDFIPHRSSHCRPTFARWRAPSPAQSGRPKRIGRPTLAVGIRRQWTEPISPSRSFSWLTCE